MPRVEAVVLDLDDTLFDHTASARAGLRAWLAGYDVTLTDDVEQAWFAAERRHHADWARRLITFDDAAGAVAALHGRGLVTAVLTNGTEGQQRAKLARIGLLDAVGPVLTAEALGVAKPSPRAFAAACDALGLAPGSVLHVGDDHALDVVAAREAGLRAVHLDRNGAGPRDDERITTLTDLDAHLDRLDDVRGCASGPTGLAPDGTEVPGCGG